MFSGGGTGGSVAPLLAIAEELRKEENFKESGFSDLRFVFVGTKKGPEKEMIESFNKEIGKMEFVSLISGKWRRYFSIHNFFDIFKIIIACFRSFGLLAEFRPDIIISAGAFVSVPLVWAAASKKIPILIHQQDLRPGLANNLMAPFARVITVVFEKSLVDYGPKSVLAGNPIRPMESIQDDNLIKELKDRFSLDSSIPLILVFGGGLGAIGINRLIFKAAPDLAQHYQIIHLTGKGKMPLDIDMLELNNYHVLEFLDNRRLSTLMSMANLVISRAGLGTLTELSYWRKPAILIPMPKSHQEENAGYFAKERAAQTFNQAGLTVDKLAAAIKDILDYSTVKQELSNNIGRIMKRNAAGTISGIIWEIIAAKKTDKKQ